MSYLSFLIMVYAFLSIDNKATVCVCVLYCLCMKS